MRLIAKLVWLLLVVIGGSANTAPGATPLAAVRFSPDVTLTLSSTVVRGGRLGLDDGEITALALADAVLPPGARISAYELLPNGDQLLSFDTTVTFDQRVPVTAHPSDVVRWNGFAFLLELDGSLLFPPGIIIDAVAVDPGDENVLILSLDTTIGANGVEIADEDLIFIDMSGQTPAFGASFNGVSAGISPAMDIDGAQMLGSGRLLLSFDTAGLIDNVFARPSDILEYDAAADTWTKVYDGSAKGWPQGSNLAALSVLPQEPTPTLTSTGTPTSTPSATATSTPTHSRTFTASATVTPTNTPVSTVTSVSTATPSRTPTITASHTATSTMTPTSTYTSTPTPSSTATPTTTSSQTATPTGTQAHTSTPTRTATQTSANTATPTATSSATPTNTSVPTSTPTGPLPPTATPTHTPPPTATSTATQPPTPTATMPPAGECTGDCSGESQVTVDELVTMVSIALGNAAVSACQPGDRSGDGFITVDEILAAVSNALNGCPALGGTAVGGLSTRERRGLRGKR